MKQFFNCSICITLCAEFLPLGLPVNIVKSVAAIIGVFLGMYILIASHYIRRRTELARRNLNQLGNDEKAILRIYIEDDISCRNCSPILDAPVASLLSKGILRIASGAFYDGHAPVAIDPVIQEQLRKTPEVIGLNVTLAGKGSNRKRGWGDTPLMPDND